MESAMKVLRYFHLDVFTEQPLAGNQLAVFLDAEDLVDREMQRIANEMAFPETTFVLSPETPGTDVRVRIFTPLRELPMAGHPTIGTTFALAGAGRLPASSPAVVLGLGVGPTPVKLEWGPAGLRFAWMKQSLPVFGAVIADKAGVAAALGLQLEGVAGGELPVQVASSGVPFLYVPLRSRQAVDAASLDRAALCALLRAANVEELPVFVFSVAPADDDASAYSRMFAPGFGIAEDPATGGASGPLAAYLLKYSVVPARAAPPLVNLQGVRLGRPSRMHISLNYRERALDEIWVGGQAVVVGEGTLRA
jgi:trans-2,3-dihydro-3-hydroxyanthranilate isomerase